MRSWRKKGIVILSILILIGVGWFGFQIKTMTITGCEIHSEDEIKDMLMNGPFGDNSIYLYLKNRFFGFDTMPFVGEVQLEWTSPRDVEVRVYEKSLVACFSYMGEYVYFDKDGVVLESSMVKMENIPLIEGVPYNHFTLNKKLEIGKEALLKRILDITQLIKHYGLHVDKVDFNNKNEVTLYCGKIKVLLGDKEWYDQQIVALSSVMEQVKQNKTKGLIDLTNYVEGGKIYLTKENNM